MSCTLVLVPVSLGSNLVIGLITSLAASAALTVKRNREIFDDINHREDISDIMATSAMKKQYEQYQTFCSEYKTMFKDENLLIKTLNEHGATNINSTDGKIYCTLEELAFEFERDNEGVYEMHITHKENEDLSVINDLKDEYQTNVQEQSYMNIKKNLENQNLTIDTEEVLEDNSIMITVNLE